MKLYTVKLHTLPVFLIVSVLIIHFFVTVASAVCKWTDKNGVFHMTDNKSSAPKGAKCDEDDSSVPDPPPSTKTKKESAQNYSEYKELMVADGIRYSYDIRNVSEIPTTQKNRRGNKISQSSILVRAETIRTNEIVDEKMTLNCMKRPGIRNTENKIQLPYQVASQLHWDVCDREE